jgi:hypothetical protein
MMKARWLLLAGIGCVITSLLAAAPALAGSRKELRESRPIASEVSAQDRPLRRRAPTRIEVRPLPRTQLPPHAYRECVPVMVERWIPQWGGRVIHASQSCWWRW